MSRKPRICFVQACWHREIVDELRFAFTEEITRLESKAPEIELWEVPGSLEIPLQIQLCAKKSDYDAFVAAGLIVDGGIYRHEFVASSVLSSVMDLQLKLEKPIVYAVLTPHHFHGEEHERYFQEHFRTKGKEAAAACAQVLANRRRLDGE